MQTRNTNCPTEPLRWSLKAICREFEVNRQTLQRRLTEARIIAGEDGLYSTHDVLAALSGDLRQERLRKVKAEATNMGLRNQERRHELLEAKEVSRVLEATFQVMRAEILGSAFSDEAKRSLLSHLADIEIPS
jgi:hypothetical protein